MSPNPNPSVPLAAVVRFPAGAPVAASIKVSDGKRQWELNYDASRKPEDGLPVVGMRPNRRHEIRVSIRDAAGKRTEWPKPLEFTTPPLPTGDEFPPLKVTGKRNRMEPGVTVMTARRQRVGRGDEKYNQGFGMLLALDEEGETVWYYRTDSRISGFQRAPNGNILFFTQDFRLFEIDLLGNTVGGWYAKGRPMGPGEGVAVDTLNFHHDFTMLPGGNFAMLGSDMREIPNYYTSEEDPAAPRKTQKVMGDEILEVQRDGKVVWKWNAFDHMDPFRIGFATFDGYWARRGFPGTVDWSHANSVTYDERDNALLVSFRSQDAIFKLDRATRKIRWILGDPDGWPENLRGLLLKPEGQLRWFYHQHSPKATAKGTLLVFDNGTYGARPFKPALPASKTYSRAIEYAIDEKKKTVQEVWASEGPGEDAVSSAAMGSVSQMPRTGNVLVSYGWLIPRGDLSKSTGTNSLVLGNWSRVREYTHTKPAEVVWEAVMGDELKTTPIGWHIFSAERWPSLL